jgi:hypothetical protein
MKYVQELPADLKRPVMDCRLPGKEYKISKMTCGVALLMSPFFLVGHGLALLSDAPANGYSKPYQDLIFFAASPTSLPVFTSFANHCCIIFPKS